MKEGKQEFKVVIEHSVTKREIHGAFNICGTVEVLRSIASQILLHLDTRKGYGWIKIVPETQPVLANTPPQDWD